MKYEEEQDDGHGVLICVRVKPIEIGPKNETASLLFLNSFKEKPTQIRIINKRLSEGFVEKYSEVFYPKHLHLRQCCRKSQAEPKI